MVGDVFTFLYDNRTWIFSGAGLFFFTAGGWLIRRLVWTSRSKGSHQDADRSPGAIQAKDATVIQGSDATAIVKSTVNISQGMSYQDVRGIAEDVAEDVYEQNFLRLSGQAKDIANYRALDLRTRFAERLEAEAPGAIGSVADPDFQYDLFVAQREYVRSGDSDLRDLLVDLLIDRATKNDDTLMRIVLNESIHVASRLTADQFDALSFVFLVRYTSLGDSVSLSDLLTCLEHFWRPFVGTASRTEARYRHLEYAGCGQIDVGYRPLEDILRSGYQSLLSKVNVLELLSQNEVLAQALEYWNESSAKSFSLTSVGMSIAHANVRRRLGEDLDLSIWIN